MHLKDLPHRARIQGPEEPLQRRQQVFGLTHEELKLLVVPMSKGGYEAIGSMGTDTPLAVLSDRPRLMFEYFKQLFAQVTNPPLDAIREELVTSLSATIGPEGNLLEPGPESVRQVELPFPIIDNEELAKLVHINDDGHYPHLAAQVIPACTAWPTAAPASAPRSTRRARRSRPRSRPASASWCCPIAAAVSSARRSHHCC